MTFTRIIHADDSEAAADEMRYWFNAKEIVSVRNITQRILTWVESSQYYTQKPGRVNPHGWTHGTRSLTAYGEEAKLGCEVFAVTFKTENYPPPREW